jgi:O-antigen/teichoic acid export membrane protein
MSTLALDSIQKVLRTLRPGRVDSSTPEGRARERHRRVLLSAGASALAKVASLAVILLTVPMLLDYLGTERFGVWITITAFPALLAFSDLGIGNGLLTAVSRASGRGDIGELRDQVSSGMAAMLAVALLLIAVLGAALLVIPWAALLNVHTPEAARELAPAVAALGLGVAAAIPAGVAGRVQTGLQQGFAVSLFQVAGSIVSLAGLVAGVHAGLGLPWLVATSVGGPLLAALCNSLLFFGLWRPDLRPALAHASTRTLRELLRLGLLFFLLQAAMAVGMSTDNLILSHFLGAQAVAQYAIPAKLFGLVSIAMAMAVTPLWPAYGEAAARGDRAWINRTVLRSMRFALVGGAAGIAVLALAMPTVLAHWVDGKIHAGPALMLALAAWTLVDCWGSCAAMYLNGTGQVRFQLAVYAVFAVACAAARIALVNVIGLPGIPLGAVLAYALTVVGPYTLLLRRDLRPAG